MLDSTTFLDPDFEPMHIGLTRIDCIGNGKLGRFWILPGSRGRAKHIADEYLSMYGEVRVVESSRGHDAYLGRIGLDNGKFVDVGVLSTGMGCPSVDIVVTELIQLGGRTLIRVGTAGNMQPEMLKVGDLVVASAAVRDDGTSRHYMPLEFPAVATADVTTALCIGCERVLAGSGFTYLAGVVHTKDSLMAREFKFGPQAKGHAEYMHGLETLGCLASEMECGLLFALGQVYARVGVRVGSVLAAIGGDENGPFSKDNTQMKLGTERAIQATLEALRVLGSNSSNEGCFDTVGVLHSPVNSGVLPEPTPSKAFLSEGSTTQSLV